MWEFALARCSGQRKLTLLGNSGIGKSGMLVYLLYRLLREGKQVLFVFWQDNGDQSRRAVLLFDSFSARVTGTKTCYTAQLGDTSTFIPQLGERRSFVLVDGVAPSFRTSAFIVLAASPDDSRSGYEEFSKNEALLFMPPWTEKEIMEANGAIYKQSEAVVSDRFAERGGFPLVVFNNPELFTPSYIAEGIQSFLVSTVMSHDAYHRVVCLQPKVEDGSVNYADFVYGFNSEYIRIHLYRDEYKQKYEEIVSTFPLMPALRGRNSEWPALEHLFSGHDLRYRVPELPGQDGVLLSKFGANVFESRSGTVRFDRMPVQVYNAKQSTTQIQPGVFYVADTCNQGGAAAWDAFFMYEGVLYFVQVIDMYRRRKHGLKKIVDLKTIMTKACVDKAIIIFEVPPDMFSEFEAQGWNNPDHEEILQVVMEFDQTNSQV